MRPDLFENMTMIDLSLPIHDDAPIWSAEPRCMVHDSIVKGRKHGSIEPLNVSDVDGSWVRAVAFVPNN